MRPVPSVAVRSAPRSTPAWSPVIAGVLAVMLGGVSGRATATDWPQFLGPHRDGTSVEAVRRNWPADGPAVLWSREVGAGFSSPVVTGDRVLLHQRRGDEEVLECFEAAKGGEPRWRATQTTTYRDDFGFDDGPRATPAVADGRVFTFGAEGTLGAFELATGRCLWSTNAARGFGADKGFFGFACSPLVTGGLVLLSLGGRDGAGLVAFEADTGRLRWRTGTAEAGYSAPVLGEFGGRQCAVFFTRAGLAIVDPLSGAVQLEHPWRSRQHASVNAATPLVLAPDRVFLTASYGTGAAMFQIGDRAARRVWSGDEMLSSHYASVVTRDGLLFGFHGRQESGPELRCVEAATGRVRWSKNGLGAGTVLLARDQLLVLTERGELLVASAAGDAFRPSARAQVLGSGTRGYPALANGRWFGRDPRRLVCLDLGESANGSAK